MTLPKTAEQIAADAERLNGTANKAAINRAYRTGRDAEIAERAIRRLRKAGCDSYGLEYAYALEAEISAIVNAE